MKKEKAPNLERFKMAILLSKKKKYEIAEAAGISPSYLVGVLNGHDRMTSQTRSDLNKILNTNI